jgi:hypothetical protein
MATVKRRRSPAGAPPNPTQSHACDSTAKDTAGRGRGQNGQSALGKLIEYDLTDVEASVFEEVDRDDGPPEPLPSPITIRLRTRDLLARPEFVAALQKRYGLLPETLREFEIGLELQRRDGPWISIPIRDEDGELVNVRRRYFGRKEELNRTGRKYRNLTGRSEARLYPADWLPPEGSSLIVCCGEFDALAARQARIAAVTSTGGANVWCEGWDDLARRFDVTITFDRGEEVYAEALARQLGGGARASHLPASLAAGADLAGVYAQRGPDGLRTALNLRRTP